MTEEQKEDENSVGMCYQVMTEEKLTEEYYNSKFKSNESHFSKSDIKQAVIFSYNKAKKEFEVQIEKMKSDYECLLDEKLN